MKLESNQLKVHDITLKNNIYFQTIPLEMEISQEKIHSIHAMFLYIAFFLSRHEIDFK